ncbi:MAG TPA: glycosyltransferase [Kofleriaceae bacterium]|nr:glycosyltransferase [Kofleriaceae bacterium]
MKIILVPIGTRGVTDPVLALALRLIERKHSVKVLGPINEAARFERHGLQFVPTSSDIEAFLAKEGTRAIGSPARSIQVAARFFRQEARRQFDMLIEHARGADAIVGAGTPLAGASVAEWLAIPYRHVFHSPTMFPSRDHAPPLTVFWQRQPRLAKRLGWAVSEMINRATIGRAIDEGRRSLGLRPISSYYRYATSNVVLAIDEQLGPLPHDVEVPHLRTGYWHAPDSSSLSPELEAFLAAGPAPVFLGFGSMTDPRPAATRVLLDNLFAARAHRFVVSSGWARLALGLQRDDVLTIGPTNYAELFPRVAAVVHHGGPGTLSCAARAGTPQVIIPHALDQFYWGERVRALGLGPAPIPRKKVSHGSILSALAQATAPQHRASARQLGERLRRRDGLVEALDAPDFWSPRPLGAVA